jgi:hypothetical protein
MNVLRSVFIIRNSGDTSGYLSGKNSLTITGYKAPLNYTGTELIKYLTFA